MQSKLRTTLAISVILKEDVAPDKFIMTFSFWSTKESTLLSINLNFVNTQTRKLGSIQAGRARAAQAKGETQMSKKQNPTTLKVREALLGNHNETALKMRKLDGLVKRHFLRSIKMRKRSLFLIFVMMLASCSSFAQNPQSPSAAPTVSVTQAPASDADADASWNTYTNAEAGFSIHYPANWQEQDLPDENAGQMHQIALQGPEGGVELVWGVGLGGACPEGYQPIAVAQGTWPACHSQREDGTDVWSLAPSPIGDTNFGGFVFTNDTTAKSREVVLHVISTIATETPASSTSTGACPSETANLKLFMNADDGYCFLYPMDDSIGLPALIIINPIGAAGGDMPGDAWAQITVESASGRTVSQVADEKIAEAGEGFNITRTEILIDGKQAVVVDGRPAQDPSREVFIVDNDRLYTLYFLPWDPRADWSSELENLYSSVITSFHVLPPMP